MAIVLQLGSAMMTHQHLLSWITSQGAGYKWNDMSLGGHVCLLQQTYCNTTDLLQPMDKASNVKRPFKDWYSQQMSK